MITIRKRNNLYFPGMDPWEMNLPARKINRLKNSWAGIFRQHVLPKLPVAKLKKYFSLTMGRPSKELYTVFGACVLQQFFDLTDIETCDHLAFDQQWHYALDILDDDEQLLSYKTLWTVRQLLLTENLARQAFDAVTTQLAEAFGVDARLQRLDSVHIHSNMARLGRVRLLARVALNFLKNLKRHYPTFYQTVSVTLTARYIRQNDPDYFGNVCPSGTQQRLEDLAHDLYELQEQFKTEPTVVAMYSYQALVRVFAEHCTLDQAQVVVKPAAAVSATSLQNPSDPDATYDGHKGQGYQVQIMETYSRNESDQPTLQLITYVAVEPAHCHDGDAVKPALEAVSERELLPEELAADTTYGSQQNVATAAEFNVKLIAPVPGQKPQHNLTQFQFETATGAVKQCPAGQIPQQVKHHAKGSISCRWELTICQNCPANANCAVKAGKNGYYLRYNRKELDIILHRQYEQSAEFKDKYRYRSGIEATNSRYIHQTGARRLRYRGLKRVSFAARLKALAINVFRAARLVVLQPNPACLAQG